jgi:hypothetical protein
VRPRRTSVTRAVNQLAARGALSRGADGAWVLHGVPPSELAA